MNKYLNKKTIIVIIIILVILGAFIFSRCFRNGPTNTNLGSSTNISQIYQSKFFSPVLSGDGNYIFYFANTGSSYAFYKLNINKLTSEKLSSNMDVPKNIYWSSNHDKAILEVMYNQYIFEKYGSMFVSPGTPDGTKTFWLYDFAKTKITPLSNSIKSVAWAPSGTKIAYQYLGNTQTNGNLAIADPDGTNWKNIADIGSQEYKIEWIDNQNIAYWSLPEADSQAISLKKVNTDNRVPEAIITKLDLADAKFLKNTNYLLVKTVKTGDTQSKVGIVDLSDQEKKFIDLGADINLDDIVFDSQNNLYYYSGNKFIKFDFNQKQKTELATFTSQPDYLLLNESNQILYFTSNDILYKLPIK